jgi:hypothetical protein
MDQLADIIEPPEYKAKDGEEKPDPQKLAMQSEIQKLTGMLQQAQQEQQGDLMKLKAQHAISQEKNQTTIQVTRENNETKLAVAELGAKVDRLALFLEESQLIGARRHEVGMASADAKHELGLKIADAQHAALMADRGHEQALEQGQAGVEGQMTLADQAAANAPQDGASA